MRVIRPLSLALLLFALSTGAAQADPAKCQKLIGSQLLKLTKTALKSYGKCLDAENIGKISGPCPDAAAQLKVQTIRDKVVAKIGASCTPADLTALGIPTDCAYETTPTGVEGTCAALPAGTPAEVGACLACWKEAEIAEYVATLYASHAVAFCGGALDETSPRCSELDCTTPLPVQEDLGDSGENDCQKAIGKAGIKHLGSVLKILEKCTLKGGNEASCTNDLAIQLSIEKAEDKLDASIRNKCGSRDPVPDPPFCCRTMGNNCSVYATRQDCIDAGYDVQEGKTCGGGGSCENVPGNQLVWWGTCPVSDTCPGTPLTSLGDLIDCVDATADEIADEFLCLQFPSKGWSCPPDASPSGAFL